MPQTLIAFFISALCFGGYAAASDFANGWRWDVACLGFATYSAMFGLPTLGTSILGQTISKHSPILKIFAMLIAGVLCSTLLELGLTFLGLSRVDHFQPNIRLGLVFGCIAIISEWISSQVSSKHT